MTEQLAGIAAHLWQSTLFAGVAALLTQLLRANHARTRYAIWLVASVKFLVPFSALVAIGRQFAWDTNTTLPYQALAAVETIATPFNSPDFAAVSLATVSAVPRPGGLNVPMFLAAAWLVGTTLLVGLWCHRWWQIRRALRTATRVSDGRELGILRLAERASGSRQVPLFASDGSLEPGIVGCLHPVILWPAAIGARLNDAQITAILLHELAHIKRRDNLLALVHMGVQAIFWFHPLVWWIGARLVDERERACDEEVVRFGIDPHQYAESILRTCEFAVESPLPCVAGVTGSDLKRRVVAIVSRRPALRLGPSKVVVLTVFGLIVAVGPLAAGALLQATREGLQAVVNGTPEGFVDVLEPLDMTAPVNVPYDSHGPNGSDVHATFSAPNGSVVVTAPAQTPSPISGPPVPSSSPVLRFDVASIKLIRDSGSGFEAVRIAAPGQTVSRFTFGGPIYQLVLRVYGIRAVQLLGAPGWLGSDDANYRIAATLPEGVEGSVENINAMIRSLLADRFNLVVQEDTRELPVYELVLARSDKALGPGLTPVAPECLEPGSRCETRMGSRRSATESIVEGRNQTVQALSNGAFGLEGRVGRLLIDRTGLTGRFNFSLKYADERVSLNPTEWPPLETALKEQLGLKLESTRAPVRVLTVISIERPTEN